jgi:hypothetical protein
LRSCGCGEPPHRRLWLVTGGAMPRWSLCWTKDDARSTSARCSSDP